MAYPTIVSTKGRLTYAGTGFGRHYHVFQKLQEVLRGRKIAMDCLVIGPGISGNSDYDEFSGYINTYQPFELANAMRNNGLDWSMDVLDINQKVLDELGKRPGLLRIDRDFWMKMHHYREGAEGEERQKSISMAFFAIV